MTRYKIILEYNGVGLIGFQKNRQGPSVQSLIEGAVFRFSGQSAEVVSCGRTDAGVHAVAMPCHFDLFPTQAFASSRCTLANKNYSASVRGTGKSGRCFPLSEERQDVNFDDSDAMGLHIKGRSAVIRRALNFYLMNSPVSVVSCEKVPSDWHARFLCKARHYRYVIANQDFPPVLDRDLVWWVPQKLNIGAMRVAAAKLIGMHDFTSFRAAGCQAKSPVKTLDDIQLTARNSQFTIDFAARSFLHHQVRNIVGTLVEIGRGKPLDIDRILWARDRRTAGPTAPATGLFFVSAEY